MTHAVFMPTTDGRARNERLKAANRRTGLWLLAISVLFFFGIIVSRIFAGPRLSIVIMGSAVVVFVIVAIVRLLRK